MFTLLLSIAFAGGDPVVATVDGHSITASEFAAAAAAHKPKDGKAFTAEERAAILEEVVATNLLWIEAQKEHLDETPRVKAVMAAEVLRAKAYGEITNASFTPEVLQAYYTAHAKDFSEPETRNVFRILVKITETRDATAAKAYIDKVKTELKPNGANFGELAAKYSQDPSKRRNGNLGFVARGQENVDPTVLAVAFKLQEKTISEPFKTAEGWNLVFVASRKAAVQHSFDEAKAEVLKAAKEEAMEKARAAYVATLTGGAKVKVDDAALGAVELPAR